MIDPAGRIAGLSPAKLKLLAQRLRKEEAPAAIPRRPAGTEVLPLSFAQQRLWFLERLDLGGPVLNISAEVRLAGLLDTLALERGLGEIVRRHEALRTRFAEADGQPLQIVEPHAPRPLPRIDLAALPAVVQRAEALRLGDEEARRGFDLHRIPLLRAALLVLGPREHRLLVTLHHIAADGWSIGVFVRELTALYGAFAAGRPSPLPELPIQYADFALWQRAWLQGKVLEEQLAWWRGHLGGDLPILQLPADRPRPSSPEAHGARWPLRLDRSLREALHGVARQDGVTPFMAVLAVFAALLQRLSGQDDLVVGTPIANRNRREVEGLIGFFTNTLPLRLDLSGDPTCGELVRRAQEASLGAFAHQDLPFEKLVEELRPERHLSRNPLFQTVLVVQNAPLPPARLAGLDLELRELYGEMAQYDLTLDLFERDGVLAGWLEYNADLFEPATAGRLAGCFATLLADFAAGEPGRPLSALRLLTDAERHHLLREWNAALPVPASPAGLHELFAERARQTPGAVAVVCDGEALTYGDLAARAGRIAARLRGLGGGPEVRVGLFLERSLDLVAALLGTLTAGAAYVPLDPDLPRGRLDLLLRDSGVPVLVTRTTLLDRLPEGPSVRLCLDDLDEETAELAPVPVPPDSLAYVIYTSGSTGTPKGVGVTHANVVRLLAATAPWFRFGADDVWTLFHSYAFDFSVWEVWGALLTGGRLVVVPLAVSRSPEAFHQLLAREKVTVLNQTPSAFRQLVEADARSPERLADLRWVLFGGEALDPRDLRSWLARYGDERPRLVNLYGITETTVHVTGRPLSTTDTARPASLVGHAIPDLALRVLDRGLEPAPIGVPGELCVGGAGLARGYLNRPDLTAQRFVPDPFGSRPGARLYRSGDLARYRADGDLEYLGRIDHQVKIRGFRIEPGEIESALREHPGVRGAVVLIWEAPGGDRRLVAYAAGAGLDPAALRRFLEERLPVYMVPVRVIALAALPLTPNGKVDRAALPAPDGDRSGVEADERAPSGPVEEVLAAIWEDLLGFERVGALDDFFALGGHSLLAARLVSRVREALGVELPLRSVFEAPTLARMAEQVEKALRAGPDGEDLPLRPLRPIPRDGHLPLSFAQERLWFLDRMAPGQAAYNVPALVRLRGRLGPGALAGALRAVAGRHEVLRTTFAERGGRPVQVVASAVDLALPWIDLTAIPPHPREAEARRLAGEEARRPFDLARGPLLRPLLLQTGADEHLLLLAQHHIVTDGWSQEILVRELAALYGGPSPLPALPVQYADYAVWQRDWLQGERLEQQLAYWRGQLGGEPPILDLPADRPRPAVQSFHGARLGQKLPADLAGSLARLGRTRGVTPFMTLLAALFAVLHRHTGQLRIAVGSPIANRGRAEVEGLLGLFVNTLVLLGDTEGDPGFGELLTRVRETALAAYAHQDLPFERLVEELRPERKLSRAPLFQVLFTLQVAPAAPLELAPGLSLEPVPLDAEAAKFDLSLALMETGEGLLASWSYSTDLFDRTTVQRLAEHFVTLLADAVAGPDRRLSDLPLLGPGERHQVLTEHNDTGRRWEVRCVHRMFEAQAARTPGAPALFFGDALLTYGDLNRQANQLARHLRGLGVGPEVRVALCVDRSFAMVAAVLGVLKAGGAYVPLDPSLPQERLRFLLEDSGAALLVTGSARDADLPAGLPRVLLDREALTALDGADLPDGAGPDNLAYVVYTSGSTGVPKGVAMRHGAVANLIAWQVSSPDLLRGGRRLQFASLGFDASFREMFSCLASGGTLILVPEELRRDLPALARFVVEEGIEQLLVPAVVLQRLAEELGRHDLESLGLRELLTAGEQVRLTPPILRLFEGHPERRLHNHYGPSETHMMAAHPLPGPPSEWPVLPPIGRPIDNVRVYLLDAAGRPVPLGVPGELCIGGVPLARGYHGRPDLTAGRFVPDPFGGEPGARLYATGDLARRRTGGELEFLGRLDHQVKIRGFRIEPGEIEAALARHPGVSKAAVIVREDGRGERRLAAYVVRAGEVTAAELRDFLQERLPEPMVPADFVFLAALPLTSNGKLDRRALPAPDPAEREAGAPFVAPRTPVEERVAAVWREVLGVERVGVRDSFFDLGGHSLPAVQVLSRLRELFQVEIPLRRLFEAPTVEGLAVEVARQRSEAIPGRVAELLSRRSGFGPGELSFAQERLWFLHQLETGTSAYNMPLGLRLTGPLDVPALRRSLLEIAARHEILRTTFAVVDGRPVQIVAPQPVLDLPLVDLSALPAGRRQPEARRLAAAAARRPFDLERGPLLRALLLRTAPGEHALCLTLHHIAGDAWSVGLLARELSAFYDGAAAEALPALPIQYADFAAWQRRWMSGERLAAELSWWRERLAGTTGALELPADRPRPAVLSDQGAALPVALPADLSQGLAALARQSGIRLFPLLLAAFQALLHRYSGSGDIAVGSPVANRGRVEIENLIGLFVNTLVLRSDLSGDPTFGELLRRVAAVAVDALEHQDLPFEKLVEELRPERNLAAQPFFRVMFQLQSAPRAVPELAGLETAAWPVAGGAAKLDLLLSLEETPEGLAGGIEYHPDLFDTPTVARLADHLTTFLAGALADPDRPLSALPLLSSAESHAVLAEWNDTADSVSGRCLHQVFEAQADATPDAPALIDGDRLLSYRELEGAANRLAHHLRDLGVGPEVPVGVALRRSADLVAAILAVLKAGGAYVPLDPAYPEARLAFMVADTQTPLVIVERESPPWLSGARAVRLEEERAVVAGRSAERPTNGADPDHLAYVLYTSGSTGMPKGVALRHGGAVALLAWAEQTFPREDLEGVLAATSVNFDLSVFELFTPWTAGGCVVLAENALALPDLPAAERVTLINTVPSAMAELVAMDALPSRLRTVNLAGEPLARALTDRIHEGHPARRVYNLYGPSESATYSTWARVERRDRRPPTIGRPVAGTRAFLLDAGLAPVPAGVPAELCLAGAGLARGYLGRPALTAERFVPNPVSGETGGRMYRTGDLARFRPDGEIEFLGRIDRQVKVRGFRIELGEIEAVLASHPAVVAAAVVVRDDGSAGRRLVGCVVPSPGAAVAPGELGGWLRRHLPDFMVPSAFVELEALPLNANGKVDRLALAALAARTVLSAGDAAPRTLAQEVVAAVWCDLLGVERVGPEDSFFELGGHSLLATRCATRLREAFGVELPLRWLFESPTLAGLAHRLEEARRVTGSVQSAPIRPVPRGEVVPVSAAQRRIWLAHQLDPADPAYNTPTATRIRGPLALPILARAAEEIVRRHEVLRTTFPAAAGGPVQRIAVPGPVPLPVVDLAGLEEGVRDAEARRILAAEARRPFDLATELLLRLLAVRLAAAEHVVFLNFHQIVADGWSLGLFLHEMARLYEAFVSGRPSPLPELPVQYADYAVWQEERLQSGALEPELAFWRERLADPPGPLALPTAAVPGAVPRRAGKHVLRFPAELRRSLEVLGRAHGATLYMTLLAGFQALLYQVSGQRDLLVGSPVANRTRPELEPLLGFFANTLVLRTDLGGDPAFAELLGRVRETVLAAHEHQDVPYEAVVEALSVIGDAPLFRVWLVLQNFPLPSLDVAGLSFRPLEVGAGGAARFDLALLAWEVPDGLEIHLEYRADRFTAATIEGMAEQLRALLELAAAQPDLRLDEIRAALATAESRRWEARGEQLRDGMRDRLRSRRSPRRVLVSSEK